MILIKPSPCVTDEIDQTAPCVTDDTDQTAPCVADDTDQTSPWVTDNTVYGYMSGLSCAFKLAKVLK